MSNQTQINRIPQTTTQQTKTKPTDFERLLAKGGKPVQYVPFGTSDLIELTPEIVMEILAVKTKSGRTCSRTDAIKFIMTCQAQRLNPFAGDCHMVGYDTFDQSVGEKIAKFAMITSHQTFTKRAEVNGQYDGMESGIILDTPEGLVEREGDFHMPDEKVVGGWAKVYRRDRSHPTYRRLSVAAYASESPFWKDDPAGQICKCSEVHALRDTFPTMMGGLRTEAESRLGKEAVEALGASVAWMNVPEPQPDGDKGAVSQPEGEKPPVETKGKPEGKKQSDTVSTQQQLENRLTQEGITFNETQKWGIETGNIPEADTLGTWSDIPAAVALRLLRNLDGMITQIKKLKAQQ